MDLDKFLKSQTFKIGAFVLLALFILLIVFKLGLIHGYKKAIYSHKYGDNYSQTYRGTFFGHHKGSFNKDIYRQLILKKKFITDKIMIDSKMDEESGAEDLTQ